MPALINTLIITVIALVIAVPLGIFSAIYLVEYAKTKAPYQRFPEEKQMKAKNTTYAKKEKTGDGE